MTAAVHSMDISENLACFRTKLHNYVDTAQRIIAACTLSCQTAKEAKNTKSAERELAMGWTFYFSPSSWQEVLVCEAAQASSSLGRRRRTPQPGRIGLPPPRMRTTDWLSAGLPRPSPQNRSSLGWAANGKRNPSPTRNTHSQKPAAEKMKKSNPRTSSMAEMIQRPPRSLVRAQHARTGTASLFMPSPERNMSSLTFGYPSLQPCHTEEGEAPVYSSDKR